MPWKRILVVNSQAIAADSKPAPLRDETIVYFGPEDWDGMWRNRHQLMSRLARQNKVIYVEPAKMLRPVLRDLLRPKEATATKKKSRLTVDESGVLVYDSPWWLPLTGRSPFRQLSVWLYLKVLARTCEIRKNCRPIIWLSRPTMYDLIGGLNEKTSIYHVVDEYTAYAGVDAKTRSWLDKLEVMTVSRVDIVIVVTPTLLKARSPHNPNTCLVPNAVDYAAYANNAGKLPADMVEIPKPVIGFSGLLSVRIDIDLIKRAATAKPDWSFVFVGSINDAECIEQINQLRQLSNVHILGNKSVASLPGYLLNFDICMIPYADDLSAEHASPLKLYEYAAVSKPIVTTGFPAANDFEGHLQIVNGVAEYVHACEQALRMSPSDPKLAHNRSFAKRNTWDDRVAEISRIIQENLAGTD
jgi:glycosyltransferase involved in cell wall biosynthesis